LRPGALSRDRGSFARHRLQLFDLHKEGLFCISSSRPSSLSFLSGADALTTYRFNTGTAQHTFCAACGIHPFYVPRSDPDKIDVNVRCLDNVDIATLTVAAFDGRNWEHAIAGRVPWR